MSTQEKLIKLEEDAKTLVDNLKELHNQAGSYEGAKNELVETRKNLEELIGKTHELTIKSHEVIQIINEIGSGNIFKKLSDIEERQVDYKKDTKKNFIIITAGLGLLILINIIVLFN